jgi:hypothetical protein
MDSIKAEFIGYKTFEKKPYVRLILEVPVEMEGHVRQVLGNTPLPGTSVWVGVARLHDTTTGEI